MDGQRYPSPARDADGAAAVLATAVAAAMDGTVLRYSARLALLQQGAAMGIGRFEANLIIAAVQHRAAATQRRPRPRKALRSLWVFAMAGAVIEAAVLLAAWLVIMS